MTRYLQPGNKFTTTSSYDQRKKISIKTSYQALDILAFKYVMYKMPVQRHNAVSSHMYHLQTRPQKKKKRNLVRKQHLNMKKDTYIINCLNYSPMVERYTNNFKKAIKYSVTMLMLWKKVL